MASAVRWVRARIEGVGFPEGSRERGCAKHEKIRELLVLQVGIVNISSVAARNGGGLGALAYASAKGALSTMTMGLAKEFAPFGIRINAVSPGTIDTNYHRNFSNEKMLSAVKAATPMARLGTAEEVADVILFLCSHESRFIQGQVIEVNGG